MYLDLSFIHLLGQVPVLRGHHEVRAAAGGRHRDVHRQQDRGAALSLRGGLLLHHGLHLHQEPDPRHGEAHPQGARLQTVRPDCERVSLSTVWLSSAPVWGEDPPPGHVCVRAISAARLHLPQVR